MIWVVDDEFWMKWYKGCVDMDWVWIFREIYCVNVEIGVVMFKLFY